MAALSTDVLAQNVSWASMSSLNTVDWWWYVFDGAVIQLIPPPVVPPEDTVYVDWLSPSLVSQGMIQYATVTATLTYNTVGSWSILLPYSDAMWNQMMTGEFVVRINWRGLFTFGGKCEQPTYSDSIPGASGGAGGLAGPFITLSGADFLSIIANRICYPDPTKPWNQQLAANADVVANVPLETAIKHFVLVNVGNQAISSRINTLLDVAPDQGRGPNVNYAVKFGSGVDLNLLDVIRTLIASSGAQMGVSVVQKGQRLLFDVYTPADKTGTAWFSEALGNLTSISFSLTDPTVTDALVQGSGSFVQASASGITNWNKAEHFNDSSSETNAGVINATAQSDLVSGAMGPNMATTATDTPYLIFGRDYNVGDKVSVEVRPGDVYQDVISSVTLTCDPSQTPILNAVPVIGNTADASSTDRTVVGQLIHRIQLLERKLAKRGL